MQHFMLPEIQTVLSGIIGNHFDYRNGLELKLSFENKNLEW